MANHEQLTLLKQGVKVWNEWRQTHRDEEIDLSEADLHKIDLCGANLREADLRGANLSEAILRETDLHGADLRGANLLYANLSQATITGAQLCGAVRSDWQIDGILCEYVFWDFEGRERTPKDSDFRPGVFEKLYSRLSSD